MTKTRFGKPVLKYVPGKRAEMIVSNGQDWLLWPSHVVESKMATVFFVEHKAADGMLYRREPAGSLHEAREIMIEILNDADEISAGDVLTIYDATAEAPE